MIQQVRDRIVDAARPEAVWLFGSAARGETHEWSDLDLLVVMELRDGTNPSTMAGQLRALFTDLHRPIDLIVQTPEQFLHDLRLPGFIARTAKREGVLLHTNSPITEVPMPDPNPEEAARAWFEKADEDLRSARALLAVRPPVSDAVAFHSQQAAEKYLKGFLACRGEDPPRTHDLKDLLDRAAGFDPILDTQREAALFLTPFAVVVRYPGAATDSDQAARALRDAEEIVRTVRACTAEPEEQA